MRFAGKICLLIAITAQLAAIGALVAVGTFKGRAGVAAKNYLLLLDVSTIKNTKNSTGLPDDGDRGNLKDFFAVYVFNYCSGKKTQGSYKIDYCSKPNGKALFDYRDHYWEDYGVDFDNVTGTTPKRLMTRNVEAVSEPLETSLNWLVKRRGGRYIRRRKPMLDIAAVTTEPTFVFRIFVTDVAFVAFAALLSLPAPWSIWCGMIAGAFCWLAMFLSIGLAANPPEAYQKFQKFLKTYKGPNGTNVSIKIGTLSSTIIWIMFSFLVVASIAWLFCMFLCAPKKPKETVDATSDEEANRSEEDRDFDIKQDVREQTAPVVDTVPTKESFITRMKNKPVRYMGIGGKKSKQSDYEPVQGGGFGNSMQQDTSYVSPAPCTQKSQNSTVYEPVR